MPTNINFSVAQGEAKVFTVSLTPYQSLENAIIQVAIQPVKATQTIWRPSLPIDDCEWRNPWSDWPIVKLFPVGIPAPIIFKSTIAGTVGITDANQGIFQFSMETADTYSPTNPVAPQDLFWQAWRTDVSNFCELASGFISIQPSIVPPLTPTPPSPYGSGQSFDMGASLATSVVLMSGWTNRDCSECSNLNGTFPLTRSGRNWSAGPIVVGTTTAVDIFLSFNSSWKMSVFDPSGKGSVTFVSQKLNGTYGYPVVAGTFCKPPLSIVVDILAQVTMGGWLNDACNECASLNGTFTLTWQATQWLSSPVNLGAFGSFTVSLAWNGTTSQWEVSVLNSHGAGTVFFGQSDPNDPDGICVFAESNLDFCIAPPTINVALI